MTKIIKFQHKKWIALFSLLFLLSIGFLKGGNLFNLIKSQKPVFASSQHSTFEERKREYINDVLKKTQQGVYNLRGAKDISMGIVRNALWAWLETGTHYDLARKAIMAILGKQPLKNHPWNDDQSVDWVYSKDVGFFAGTQWDNLFIVRILLQYKDRIPANDYSLIKNAYFRSVIANSNFLIAGNPNQMIQNMAGVYLYAENFGRNIQFTYGKYKNGKLYTLTGQLAGSNWRSFSYGGRSYIPGHTYNLYQFSKDWLSHRFDEWVNTKSGNLPDWWEFDSETYTKAFIAALMAINDFSQDQYMKTKSKMALDLMLYDYMADLVGGNQHGSASGRSYFHRQMTHWSATSYEYVLFGIPVKMDNYSPVRVGYVSHYRPPAIMRDLLDLNDEPDSYWYILKEYNPRLHEAGTGKWNFVTKYFNLGGGYKKNWELNIQACPRQGYPFRVWMNKKEPNEKDNNIQGGTFYQYRNAIFAPNWQKLIVFTNNQPLEKDETRGGWRFLKECKTMVAFKTSNTSAAMQVEVLGDKYNSFRDFEEAILTKAKLGSDYFKTSRGDVITAKNGGSVNGKPIWHFPFQRLEIEDYKGNKVIDWENNIMTVTLHNKTYTYNFNNWTYADNVCQNKQAGSISLYGPDINQDGEVDIRDLGILLSYWGTNGSAYHPRIVNCIANPNLTDPQHTNPSDIIDVADLKLLLAEWGKK